MPTATKNVSTKRPKALRKPKTTAPIMLFADDIAEGRMVRLVEEAEGGYSASIPVLPGCHSQGDTLDEALQNIEEAAELYLEYAQTKKAE